MRRWLTSGGTALLLLLTACESTDTRTGPDGSATARGPDVVDGIGELRYRCGQSSFDPRRLEGPGDLEHSDSALGAALRDLLATPDGDIGGEGWRIVWEKEKEVYLAAPSPGRHPYVTALFRRSKGKWQPAGWGDCLPTAVMGGERLTALWELEAEPPDDATQLRLLVQERECTSGRTLTEEMTRAGVEYSQDAIVILVSTDPLEPRKDYTCQGVPPAPVTIEFDEPVGGRALVDAGSYPPTRRDV